MTAQAIANVLGGTKVIRRRIASSSDLMRAIRDGLPAESVPVLAGGLAVDRKAVARIVGIPERTLTRRLSSHARLTSDESDRTVRVARILALASDVLGDKARASQWLQTPNRALQNVAPFELLDNDTGVQTVETILGRISYGVYS